MKFKQLLNKHLFVIIISIIVVLDILVIAFSYQYLSQRKNINATARNRVDTIGQTAAHVVEVSSSPETSVETKVVAAKLDLQRKIIIASSAQKVEQIRKIITDNGGEIKNTNGTMVVAIIPKESEQEVNELLQSAQSVESIEVDHPTFITADTPDWGVKRIKAPDVWETTSASGIRIAVIDTGIDYNHSDLSARYGGGYDSVNEDTDPYDDHGHGTHVAGIVASDLNNSGMVGVAPKAQILAVKVLSEDGSGYMSDLIEGIDWAIQNNVHVMNFSLGASSGTKALEDKLNEAAARGILLVAAAGNTNGGALLYPAAYSSVISVSATDSNDQFASFSSLGAEIAAPGVAITSSIPGGGYVTWSGTSLAAPHVTATIALMIANNQVNIRENLRNTAIDLGPAGKDNYYGYGLVHAKPAALGEDLLAPLVTFLSPEHTSIVNGTVEVSIGVQDENLIEHVKLFIDSQEVNSWTGGPYVYEWNTTGLIEKEYEILVQAVDEYENKGESKISVTVSSEAPSPTLTATPTPSIHPMQEQGSSGSVRQDTNQEQAQENRQDDKNVPNSPQEASQNNNASSSQGSSSVPDVTNLNQRNQKPEESPSQASPQSEGKGKVRGASTKEKILKNILDFFKF